MIEISNEELAKVLNLWTGTEEWVVDDMRYLDWEGLWQRRPDGGLVAPSTKDVEAHALVNFMLKERKYPAGGRVFFPIHATHAAREYVLWVTDWEKRFSGMSQEELCIPPSEQVVDHSIPVRYDHLISTEELVKRAREKWPDDGWSSYEGGGGVPVDNICDNLKGKPRYWYLEKGCLDRIRLQPSEQRAKLLTIISEAGLDEQVNQIEETADGELRMPQTKAERFYTFLATLQPDISLGLWGNERELQAPVRGGDGGWAREDVGALSDCPIAQSEYRTVRDMVEV